MRVFRFIQKFSIQYKSLYGQAGKLSLNLQNSLFDLRIRTIWEDYTIIDIKQDEQETNWNFEDCENTCSLSYTNKSNDKVYLNAFIPEYYSYGGIVNGSVIHESELIDSKIYGNITLDICDTNGQFNGNKIKSDIANIRTIDGNIEIQKYLEAQNAQIVTVRGDIKIKKLATPKLIQILTEEGSINISSFYGYAVSQKMENVQFPVPNLQYFMKKISAEF